ncbi:MAG: hypothetical protein AAF928_20580, partial [Myxococcota bacterium]
AKEALLAVFLDQPKLDGEPVKPLQAQPVAALSRLPHHRRERRRAGDPVRQRLRMVDPARRGHPRPR